VLKFFFHFSGLRDPDADDFQSLASTSLWTDKLRLSLVKFLQRSGQ